MIDSDARATRYFTYKDIGYCFYKILGERVYVSWTNDQGVTWHSVENPLEGVLENISEPELTKKGYLRFNFESTNGWVMMERNMENFEHKFLKTQSRGTMLQA